jgi:predicted RNA-binding protein (virulence factor B family)
MGANVTQNRAASQGLRLAWRSMPLDELFGRVCRLTIRRLGPPGAFLVAHAPAGDADPDAPTVLLPRGEVPDGAKAGDELAAFVYLDSDDRPVATLRAPRLELGEVTFLAVTDVGRFGAFVDWGLPKELLVPFAEQTRDVGVGERHPIGLYLDKTGRLAGTMRVSEMLRTVRDGFALDEWVEGEAWRNEPDIGLFVIVERARVGLVPASEPHALTRGQAARFRVTNILADGKIELSLRGLAHEELDRDGQTILAVLARGNVRVGDRSTPEEIRALFGLSKKAFKRAVGRLLKERAVEIDGDGFLTAMRR